MATAQGVTTPSWLHLYRYLATCHRTARARHCRNFAEYERERAVGGLGSEMEKIIATTDRQKTSSRGAWNRTADRRIRGHSTQGHKQREPPLDAGSRQSDRFSLLLSGLKHLIFGSPRRSAESIFTRRPGMVLETMEDVALAIRDVVDAISQQLEGVQLLRQDITPMPSTSDRACSTPRNDLFACYEVLFRCLEDAEMQSPANEDEAATVATRARIIFDLRKGDETSSGTSSGQRRLGEGQKLYGRFSNPLVVQQLPCTVFLKDRAEMNGVPVAVVRNLFPPVHVSSVAHELGHALHMLLSSGKREGEELAMAIKAPTRGRGMKTSNTTFSSSAVVEEFPSHVAEFLYNTKRATTRLRQQEGVLEPQDQERTSVAGSLRPCSSSPATLLWPDAWLLEWEQHDLDPTKQRLRQTRRQLARFELLHKLAADILFARRKRPRRLREDATREKALPLLGRSDARFDAQRLFRRIRGRSCEQGIVAVFRRKMLNPVVWGEETVYRRRKVDKGQGFFSRRFNIWFWRRTRRKAKFSLFSRIPQSSGGVWSVFRDFSSWLSSLSSPCQHVGVAWEKGVYSSSSSCRSSTTPLSIPTPKASPRVENKTLLRCRRMRFLHALQSSRFYFLAPPGSAETKYRNLFRGVHSVQALLEEVLLIRRNPKLAPLFAYGKAQELAEAYCRLHGVEEKRAAGQEELMSRKSKPSCRDWLNLRRVFEQPEVVIRELIRELLQERCDLEQRTKDKVAERWDGDSKFFAA
ncbi:unnamed protein product [Amoebophrya sp. A120]|nr:unnamed protein product [Amoebophrya sp. A120]|eukprot:GSA120T00007058001.1